MDRVNWTRLPIIELVFSKPFKMGGRIVFPNSHLLDRINRGAGLIAIPRGHGAVGTRLSLASVSWRRTRTVPSLAIGDPFAIEWSGSWSFTRPWFICI